MQSKIIRETHKTRALYYIRTYGSITSLEAIRDLGNTRLSDTIFRLRNDGYGISTEDHQVATRWLDAKGGRRYSTVAKYVYKTNKP
jgi:hypothetical protein|tara:strand:+ start:5432 stop:5689 length:258 start_codon:yes stop_codon:yes gene_type:complete